MAVDLGPRGMLFALLKQGTDPRSSPEYIVLRAFGFPHGAMPTPVEEGIARIAALKGRVELPIDSLPMLVRFRDPADPKTVERVNPRNLAASFGEGVRIAHAWIDVTNDPVTTGWKRVLPCLDQYYDKHLDGERWEHSEAPNRLVNSLSSGSFSTELQL